MWDPDRYLEFRDERARPFLDLLARLPDAAAAGVEAEAAGGTNAAGPGTVVDLGCGPGNLTRNLADRWPGARVVGVDSSNEMIERARAAERPSSRPVEYVCADLREWQPAGPVDVVVSNAVLQWVPGHLDLLPQLVGYLRPGGWLAVQVPADFDAPVHRRLREVCDCPRWQGRLGADRVARPMAYDASTYLTALMDLGCDVDAWETTYLHVLPGDDAVLRWISGTGARPAIAALDETDRQEFLSMLGERLREAYPRGRHGTLLPFRRVFVVARRAAETASGSTVQAVPSQS